MQNDEAGGPLERLAGAFRDQIIRLLSVLVLLGVIAVCAVVLPPQPAVHHGGDDPSDNTNQNQESYIDKVIEPATILNFVLAVSTILMWWSTRSLAALTAKSAQIAERALTDLERPYIFVSGVNKFKFGAEPPNNGRSPYIQYIVSNFGRMPAIVTEARADFLFSKSKKIGMPVTVYEDNPLFVSPVVGPNEQRGPINIHVWRVSDSDAAEDDLDPHCEIKYNVREIDSGEQEVIPILAEDENLFLRVIIKYRGPFTGGHETSACWIYLKGFGYFEPWGKNTNYEK